MKKESIMIGIIGLLIGTVVTGFAAGRAVNNNNTGMMQMMGMNISHMKDNDSDHMGMSMSDMSNDLQNRTGDDFDENFVAMMIAHHEGAINMAKLAESRAKHDEVKQLSKNIISAQTKEIEEMKKWQQDWGYSTDGSMQMMHGSY